MFKFLKKNSSGIALAVAALLCFSLLVFSIVSLTNYSDAVYSQVSDKAELYARDLNDFLVDVLSKYENATSYCAGKLKSYDSKDAFLLALKTVDKESVLSDISVKSVRFVKDNILYEDSGEATTDENLQKIVVNALTAQSGTTGIAYDIANQNSVIGFYSAVSGNENADYIVLFFPESLFNNIGDEELEQKLAYSEFAGICTADGKCVVSFHSNDDAETFSLQKNENVSEALKIAVDSDSMDEITALLNGTENGTVVFSHNGEAYALSIKHNAAALSFATVTLYRANAIDSNGYTFVSTIASVMIILFIVALGVLAYAFITHRLTRKRLERREVYNDDLNCYTLEGFKKQAKENLEKYTGSQFAVVSGKVKHFDYIKENFGAKADDVVSYICGIHNNNLDIGEIFCYTSGGEFIALFHYKEMRLLVNRVRAMGVNITNGAGTKKFNVKMMFGIYAVAEKGDDGNVDLMINNAVLARDSESSATTYSFVNVYSDLFKENYVNNAEIEIKMDFALEHEEFKVFFQPKFNVKKNEIEGCEALVRWYDEEHENYRLPGLFLPLFEQNGFIIKLDRYVYYKVCEFIGLRISEHLPVYPCSVNISRLTALSSDFLDYYISIKRKFSVPDDFITLEFTESVASESYETLNNIAKALHQNHFLCSIDDFGSGYSSFNILKNMSVDEIKLDRTFLDAGLNAERDKDIICSIVQLAHTLGIKVVQEGVETSMQLEYVKETQCEIIQGYFYSRPLHMLDYIKFIEQYGRKE